MTTARRTTLLLLCSTACAFATAQTARQPTLPTAQPDARTMVLNVVVAPKSGVPVSGLHKEDFTVLDNKVAQPILSFQALGGPAAPVNVILVLDAVNANVIDASYERQQIDKFLQANGGHLAHPVTMAVFTDTGVQLQQTPSTDGNAISASLDQNPTGLRSVRATSQWQAQDRINLSTAALRSLAQTEASIPGRKIVFWVSPGWPLLSGPEVDLDRTEAQQIFSEITDLTAQLRRADITLDSIDPLGADASAGEDLDYQRFLKGASKSTQVDIGDLALQVLAMQSGGLALTGSNNIAGELDRCMADTDAYYRIAYTVPPTDHADEYHQIEIKLSQPGLTARTRNIYYSSP